MVICPLSPRATSLPARRRRSRVGNARRSTPLLPSPGAKRRGEGLGVGAPPAPPASASLHPIIARPRRPRPQIGARAVRGAVRLVAQNLRAAEEEGRRARFADRPSAVGLAQRKERAALGNRDLRVEARIFEVAFGLEQRRRRSHPVQGEGAPAHVLRPRRARNVLQLLPPPGRAAIGRQSRNAEAMDLRNRVRADPQLSTDLARPCPLLPAPAQMAQAFLGPWQGGARAWWPRQVEQIWQHGVSLSRSFMQLTTIGLYMSTATCSGTRRMKAGMPTP